jgi:hypothetical protein
LRWLGGDPFIQIGGHAVVNLQVRLGHPPDLALCPNSICRCSVPPSRILIKQNRLLMSQVSPFRVSMIKWALLFKDSMSGTEERVKLPNSHSNYKCTHRSKTKRCPPRGIAWTFTFNKLRSRISEAASPNRCCSHAALLIPRPRGSEARPR